MPRATVAAVVADGLCRAGVARVFASPGAPSAVVAAVRERGLTVVETAGATAACLMAAVTGELGDAPGVALVPLGGRLAAVVDGAAHATRDRAATIVISDGAADARLLGPVVKASVVADAASAGHWIAHAAQAAMAEPRGAVHLAVPAGVAETATLPVAASCRRAPLPAPSAESLDALAEAIAAAARPVLVAGLETGPGDAPWFRALAESLPAPVLTTPKGKGVLPDPHPLAHGLLDAGHPLLAQADLLILVGVDPVEARPGVWPAGTRLVRIARSVADDVVFGEIALVIEELAPRLRDRVRADWDVAALDRLKRSRRVAGSGPGLARRRVVELAREMTPAGTTLALDVPLADAWASVAPRDCLIPNGVATLGFALPAALAAALARADGRVVAIGGAAGFAAMAAEWPTVARLGAPVVAVALNEAGATDLTRAAGVDVVTATDEASFRAGFDRAWRGGGPALIDARVSR
ncbi:MAG TPA: thiamine pyrophosphate-dependent enzyme [Methylomirabilota bacterium]|jgi:acetolactate synthase-1/2/3 large subunit|nr:thiamine pyrophosphate-dependent enzyme [Methylomirabilota bacterium]